MAFYIGVMPPFIITCISSSKATILGSVYMDHNILFYNDAQKSWSLLRCRVWDFTRDVDFK